MAVAWERAGSRARAALAWTVLLAAGLGLRAYDLGRSVYWNDEAWSSVVVSGHPWEEIRADLAAHEFRPDDALRFQRPSPDRGLVDSVRTLAHVDPQHAPLYFVTARAWAGLAGGTPAAIRGLSVLGGLLVIPLFFGLAIELFSSRRAGWLAAGLALVSPFHVFYAREARPYAWLAVAVLASSTLLLRASRRGSARLWALYSLSVAAGLYLHMLFAAVLAAHGVWVAAVIWMKAGAAPGRIPRALGPFALAATLGVASFVPWLLALGSQWATASNQVSWTARPVGIVRLIGQWAFNYSAVFCDTDISIIYMDRIPTAVILAFAFRAVLLAVVGAGLVILWRKAGHEAAAFVTSLLVVPFLPLAVPDLIWGGWRSGGGSRYLLASYVGLELATAHMLAWLLSSRRRVVGLGLTLTFAACGLYSCMRLLGSDTWWAKGLDYFTPGVIRRINQAEAPLLYARINGRLMTLAHGLHPDVRIRAMEAPDGADVAPTDKGSVFVYVPTPEQKDGLRRRFGDAFACVDPKGDLWRIADGRRP